MESGRLCHCGLGILLAICSLHAQAGRPLVTEDADVLAPKTCEWESMAAKTRVGGLSVNAWGTQIGCGVGWQSQIALATGRSDGHPWWGVGGKSALIERKGDDLGLTLAWGLISAKPEGGSMRHDVSSLNLVLTRSLGHALTGHANLGWIHSRIQHQSATTWNLALEWAAQPGLDWMAEIYGDNHSKPWLGLGVRYAVSSQWSLNASVAQQRETPRVRLFTVGAKLSF